MIVLGRVSRETKGVGVINYEDLALCIRGGALIDEDDVCKPR